MKDLLATIAKPSARSAAVADAAHLGKPHPWPSGFKAPDGLSAAGTVAVV